MLMSRTQVAVRRLRSASAQASAGLARRMLRPVLVLVLVHGALLSAPMTMAEEASPLGAYPGRLVGVGGHDLHLDCRGRGHPLVVLESGLGGFSLEWRAVQEALATFTRVCSYDRAGYGWSDGGSGPRTAAVSAAELHDLLETAGERPPYVLAGHSYGAYIVRLFAARYAHEVVGLVLVDAAAPEQFSRLPDVVLPRSGRTAQRVGTPLLPTPRDAAGFPPAARTLGLQLMMLPKARRAYLSELRHFEASAQTLAGQRDGAFEMPLIVVSRARAEFAPQAARAEHVWRDMQRRMCRLSPRSAHWIAADAGHRVHVERPQLVARALAAVRRSAGASAAAPLQQGLGLVLHPLRPPS